MRSRWSGVREARSKRKENQRIVLGSATPPLRAPATVTKPAPAEPVRPAPPASRRGLEMEPVSGEEWLLRMRLSDRVKRKLQKARELSSHALGAEPFEAVLEAA